MIVSIVVLLVAVLLPGLATIYYSGGQNSFFRYSLVFSGTYLFSITIIHILPDLFGFEGFGTWLGVMVLAGFFLQRVLEFFTQGVEHGHLHSSVSNPATPSHPASVSLLVALCVHAFLEGTLLAGESDVHRHLGTTQILLGIAFHKAPAAFALVSVLMGRHGRKRVALMGLMIFALATPLGLLSSSFLYSQGAMSDSALKILFALVAGNFLYISTTIFYESSPGHGFKAGRFLVSLLGGALAVVMEVVLGRL